MSSEDDIERVLRSGERLAAVSACLDRISRHVVARDADGMDQAAAHFDTGLAGAALLHDRLEAIQPGRGHAAIAARAIDAALDALAEQEFPPDLFGGFVGVSHVVEMLRPEEDTSAVDEALLELLAVDAWSGSYDLISGLVGFGARSLAAGGRGRSNEVVSEVVRRLVDTASARGDGLVWMTNPLWIAPRFRAGRDEPHVDLGIAHGLPGVIALLGRAARAGVLPDVARDLAVRAVDALLSFVQPEPLGGLPFVHISGRPPERARLAWCYGELSAAIALVAAGQAFDMPAWIAGGTAFARSTLTRSFEETAIADGYLCHGLVGAAHVYASLARATGELAFAEAAASYYDRVLIDGAFDLEPRGILMGVEGVGLALASFVRQEGCRWDAFLLLPEPLEGH